MVLLNFLFFFKIINYTRIMIIFFFLLIINYNYYINGGWWDKKFFSSKKISNKNSALRLLRSKYLKWNSDNELVRVWKWPEKKFKKKKHNLFTTTGFWFLPNRNPIQESIFLQDQRDADERRGLGFEFTTVKLQQQKIPLLGSKTKIKENVKINTKIISNWSSASSNIKNKKILIKFKKNQKIKKKFYSITKNILNLKKKWKITVSTLKYFLRKMSLNYENFLSRSKNNDFKNFQIRKLIYFSSLYKFLLISRTKNSCVWPFKLLKTKKRKFFSKFERVDTKWQVSLWGLLDLGIINNNFLWFFLLLWIPFSFAFTNFAFLKQKIFFVIKWIFSKWFFFSKSLFSTKNNWLINYHLMVLSVKNLSVKNLELFFFFQQYFLNFKKYFSIFNFFKNFLFTNFASYKSFSTWLYSDIKKQSLMTRFSFFLIFFIVKKIPLIEKFLKKIWQPNKKNQKLKFIRFFFKSLINTLQINFLSNIDKWKKWIIKIQYKKLYYLNFWSNFFESALLLLRNFIWIRNSNFKINLLNFDLFEFINLFFCNLQKIVTNNNFISNMNYFTFYTISNYYISELEVFPVSRYQLNYFFTKYKSTLNAYMSNIQLVNSSFGRQISLSVETNLIKALFFAMVKNGKYLTAWKTFFKFLKTFWRVYKIPTIAIFTHSVLLLEPGVWLKKKKVAGKIYEIPIYISSFWSQSIAIWWLLKAAWKRNQIGFSKALVDEIWDSCFGRGSSYSQKKNLHIAVKKGQSYSWWL